MAGHGAGKFAAGGVRQVCYGAGSCQVYEFLFVHHEELELPEKDKMYVLSNKLKYYGAACIAYPNILDMLAGVLKETFYVLPSSVHEVIIVPESSQIRQSELDRMVREIYESQVPEEEILSNHAYFYYAQEGKLQLGREMCIDREENE